MAAVCNASDLQHRPGLRSGGVGRRLLTGRPRMSHATSPASYVLNEFSITSFRNIESLELDFGARSALILGRNAQGKTSLLEAVCVLARLQSPRTRRLAQTIRHGSELFRLAGFCGGHKLAFGYSARERSLRLDGADVDRASDYLAVARVTWLAGADLQIVRGNAEARRTFADFSASQLFPGYLASLRRYHTALRQRNRLLKDNRSDLCAIRAFNAPLASYGAAVAGTRAAALDALAPHAAAAYAKLSARREAFSIRYSGWNAPPESAPSSENFEDMYAKTEEQDLRAGATTAGPHRDTLELEIEGCPAGSHASEGQQRCVALALRLAHHRAMTVARGVPPLVLVDDAFGELDEERRRALFAELDGAQCLIATTSPRWLPSAAMDFPRYVAENGRFTKQ